MTTFRRFQSAVPNRHGHYPGIFALANGLAADGRLSPADRAWWEATNRQCDELYADPSTLGSRCYDPVVNPGARAWFRASAAAPLAVTAGYLAVLDRYGVPWVELRTDSPGHIVYQDDVQVVAVPYSYPNDWSSTWGSRTLSS